LIKKKRKEKNFKRFAGDGGFKRLQKGGALLDWIDDSADIFAEINGQSRERIEVGI
jgi:hypothetical protein